MSPSRRSIRTTKSEYSRVVAHSVFNPASRMKTQKHPGKKRIRKLTMEWTEDMTHRLVKHVAKHECLWNPQDPDYKNRQTHHKTWQTLASSLMLPKNELIVKWSAFRGNYRLYLKKQKHNKSNTMNPLFAHMSFLDPILLNLPNSSSSNMDFASLPSSPSNNELNVDSDYSIMETKFDPATLYHDDDEDIPTFSETPEPPCYPQLSPQQQQQQQQQYNNLQKSQAFRRESIPMLQRNISPMIQRNSSPMIRKDTVIPAPQKTSSPNIRRDIVNPTVQKNTARPMVQITRNPFRPSPNPNKPQEKPIKCDEQYDQWAALGNLIVSNARTWSMEDMSFARRYKAALSAVNAQFELESVNMTWSDVEGYLQCPSR